MEGALLALAGKAGLDIHDGVSDRARTDAIAFDARHRFMATLHHDHPDHADIFVKGAPERVLEMCAQQRGATSDQSLDEAYWIETSEKMAAQGHRVLAIAARQVDTGQTTLGFSDVEGGLTLLGLVGLMDPPRPEAITAVAECRDAGIRVKMITGDHAGTAAAIGRLIGLQNPDRVLTGAAIDRMDDAHLAAAVLDADIFARTNPEHKLRLVTALQAHGLTVAMTGDGVNDAPALKRADAGIAMGLKGSEAAKEAAELVLADDNFASIVAAVREGRTVYDNIKKVISWTLPTNAGEAMTIIVALLFGMTLPITPVQILWINLVTAITLGLALAFEPTEENTMRRPPRPRHEPILTGHLAWQIALVSGLFFAGVFGIYAYATGRGHSVELARTMAMNTLVVMEIFYLFFIRNFLRHIAHLGGGARDPHRLEHRHCGDCGAIRGHLCAAAAICVRNRGGSADRRRDHRRHRRPAVCNHRSGEATPVEHCAARALRFPAFCCRLSSRPRRARISQRRRNKYIARTASSGQK